MEGDLFQLSAAGEALLEQIRAALRFHYFTNGSVEDKETVRTKLEPVLRHYIQAFEDGVSIATLDLLGDCGPPRIDVNTLRRLFLDDLRQLLVEASLADDTEADDQIFYDEMGPELIHFLEALEVSTRHRVAISVVENHAREEAAKTRSSVRTST